MSSSEMNRPRATANDNGAVPLPYALRPVLNPVPAGIERRRPAFAQRSAQIVVGDFGSAASVAASASVASAPE